MRNKCLHTVQRGSVPNAFEGKESLQTYLKVQKHSAVFFLILKIPPSEQQQQQQSAAPLLLGVIHLSWAASCFCLSLLIVFSWCTIRGGVLSAEASAGICRLALWEEWRKCSLWTSSQEVEVLNRENPQAADLQTRELRRNQILFYFFWRIEFLFYDCENSLTPLVVSQPSLILVDLSSHFHHELFTVKPLTHLSH